MGLTHSYFAGVSKIIQVPTRIYLIQRSQFYNFFQESLLFPGSYIFYDIRSRDSYIRNSPINAIWLWEMDKRHQRQNVVKLSQRSYENDYTNKKFLKHLENEVESKIVVFIGDKKTAKILNIVLGLLVTNKLGYQLCTVLKDGFKSINNSRYKVVWTSSMNPNGPIEVEVQDALYYFLYRFWFQEMAGVYISGTDIVSSQSDMLKRFNIESYINISETQIVPHSDSVKMLSPPISSVVCVQAAKMVLELINQGREYAAATCVAILIIKQVIPNIAVQYVKEMKPSADVNFLTSILGLEMSESMVSKKTHSFRNLVQELNKSKIRIPLNLLDIKYKRDKAKHFTISNANRYQIKTTMSKFKGYPEDVRSRKSSWKHDSSRTISDVDDLFSECEIEKSPSVETVGITIIEPTEEKT